MSNNNNGESKDEVVEGKRGKNTPKRRKFRSFSLGKYIMTLFFDQVRQLVEICVSISIFFFNLEYFI